MKPSFSVALAYNEPHEMRALAIAAEECGYGSVILSDHLVYPADLRTPYPYTRDSKPRWQPETPWPDPLVTVGALSSVTETLRFIVSIYVLPLRHPAQAAKAVSTAAILSGDRLVLGVGAGWMREEFDLVGQRFERRGARLAESIEVMRKLWSGEPVSHEGEFYSFDAMQMRPAPEIEIPIWGGGLSKPALRRAATHCDGWLSEIQTTEDLLATMATLRDLRADSPRADLPFEICAASSDSYGLDGYRRLAEAGVRHIITVPWLFYGKGESLEDKLAGMRRFAEEILVRI